MEVSLETQEFDERKNRTLIDMARSMLSEYNVSDSFWAETINTACHASNRLYCHRFHNKTPYELLIGRKPNISYFRVLIANATFSRRELDYQNSKANVIKVFFLGIHLVARLNRFIIKLMELLKRPMMWSLMKQMVHMMNKKILMM